uniref:Uncharacterized protein n=1 Tax=Romanomermis culicivorax TaxID=13658 RepID=A0A915IZK6_ROMCU
MAAGSPRCSLHLPPAGLIHALTKWRKSAENTLQHSSYRQTMVIRRLFALVICVKLAMIEASNANCEVLQTAQAQQKIAFEKTDNRATHESFRIPSQMVGKFKMTRQQCRAKRLMKRQ